MLNHTDQPAPSHELPASGNNDEIEHYRVRLEILKSISTHLTSAMSVQDVIERTLDLIQRYFPLLRVSYATVNLQGQLTVAYCTRQPAMLVVTGLQADLNQAPA